MRILELKLSAMGPYEKEIRLDFSELNDNAFLLIHGATGAGKTSIFDAICFALYGEGSMKGRSAALMRNTAASPDVDTYVELTFSVGGESYQIRRIPTYQRRAKRGGGLTTQTAEVYLERLTGEHFIWSREREVAPEVERLLGLKCDQFRQVVLLPQGEFQKFLMAKTDERRELLSVIFNTGLYARLERKLRSKTDQLQKELKDSQLKNEELLRGFGVVAIDELKESIENKEKGLATQKEALTALKREAQTAKDEEAHGRALEGLFAELLAAKRYSESKAAVAKDDEKKRARLELAQRAVLLMEAEGKRNEARIEAQKSEQALKKLKELGIETKAKYEEAERILAREEELKPEREREKEQLLRLNGLLDSAARLEKKRGEEKELTEKAETASRRRQELERERKEAEARLDDNRSKREQAAAAEAEGKSAALRAANLERALKNKQLLVDAAASMEAAELKVQRAEAVWKDAKEKLEEAKKAESQLLLLERRTRAAILAEGLIEGEPCPVCGATHHPHLATALEKVTEEMLKEAEKERNECEGLERSARSALDTSRLELKGCKTSHANLLKATEGDERGIEALQKELFRENRAKEIGERAANSLIRFKREEQELLTRREKFQDAQAQAQRDAESLNTALAALRAELDTLKSGLPKDLQGAGRLSREIGRLERSIKAGERRYEGARTKRDSLKEQLSGYQGQWHATRTQMQHSREKAQREDVSFKERLLVAQFASEEAYRAALAGGLREAARRKALEEELLSHEKELHAARERLRRAKGAVEGKVRPDMEALTGRVRELDARVSECSLELGKLEGELSRAQKGLLKCEARRKKEAELEHAYSVAASLSEWANGAKGEHISFQSYVLGWLLDEVLTAANIRLLRMSRDRYTLVRGERARKNAHGGLDLAVMDSYTGEARPMATLSGGESFLASLSLALGLSDIVQQEAGGVHLDTMFIDEGFGTLDSETLDHALEVLMELAGEGRLVGIISHVEELRRRIPARLEVRKLPAGGSTARFVFGTEED